mmetsp:Transcript_29301/g.83311  ORF Transcript_29301/g.83311 Transcript_29301/m.83311 type:complete len:251 (+) Transcript_29301:125-877(+)
MGKPIRTVLCPDVRIHVLLPSSTKPPQGEPRDCDGEPLLGLGHLRTSVSSIVHLRVRDECPLLLRLHLAVLDLGLQPADDSHVLGLHLVHALVFLGQLRLQPCVRCDRLGELRVKASDGSAFLEVRGAHHLRLHPGVFCGRLRELRVQGVDAGVLPGALGLRLGKLGLHLGEALLQLLDLDLGAPLGELHLQGALEGPLAALFRPAGVNSLPGRRGLHLHRPVLLGAVVVELGAHLREFGLKLRNPCTAR